MKRFTETCKWDDPWFRGLTGVQKLVFLYVIDRCNNAGFWEVDEDSLSFHTKLKPELILGALEGLSRGLIGAYGWMWVRRFLKHQNNERLNPDNNAHKQIISQIQDQIERFKEVPAFVEFLAPHEPLLRGLGTVKVKVQTGREGEVQEGKAVKSKGTREECQAFAVSIELPAGDGDWYFDKCEGSGWKNDGRSIADWKATFRAWKRLNLPPSLKQYDRSKTSKSTPSNRNAGTLNEGVSYAGKGKIPPQVSNGDRHPAP